MSEFIFTSPGIKFKEVDLTQVVRNVGVTTLGLVGETMKGPAFEPVYLQDKGQYSDRFGGQSVKRFTNGTLQYQLPYVANSYLEESNQLWVTRVLGLSGYYAGTGYTLTLEAGINPATMVKGTSTPFSASFTAWSYLGVSINALNDTGTVFSGFTKTGTTGFRGISKTFKCITYTASTGGGTVTGTSTVFTGTEYTTYKNMVLALIRSRGTVYDHLNLPTTTSWDARDGVTVVASGNTTKSGIGDLFGSFKIKATSGSTTESYVVSLNPDASSFLPNVIGYEPKDKTTKIWVEAVYPDLIKKLDSDGDSILNYALTSGFTTYGIPTTSSYAYGVSNTVIKCSSEFYSNYETQFKTPETPWVVSQIKGNSVSKLFKFISISDGDAANQEIKISIVNINPITLEFDVMIRSFYDTDDNVNILESFTRCSLVKGLTNYIAQRIGTSDGEYDLESKYIMIEVSDDLSYGDFPAGFEGYLFNNYSSGATDFATSGIAPKIFYKTKYNDDEKIKKVYLGISENGYDTVSSIGTGINQNFFNFNGQYSTGSHVKTHGFHMDIDASGVTSNGYSFDCGDGTFQGANDVLDITSPYYLISTRKFSLVPAGGFDGWNVNRIGRSYGDGFQQNGIFDGVLTNVPAANDFQAWETAINTFANPEEVTINVFATPGINWADQTILIQNTIEMIETQRTDSLYVIDSPDVTIAITIGDNGKADVLAANEIVDLLDNADIDSSYSCTYFPWIQMRDTQNNVNIYLPPTGEVTRALAYTDNTKFPWFAPAGLNRGVTNARKSKYKLSQDARDILYAGRINPMADFADTGTAIFGQKTLQVKESALDRINVRRLLLQVKVLIANIAIRLVFEQNDQTTIDQFLAKANPILDTIKRERGLYDFKITMNDTNNSTETQDRNELFGKIGLKPTRSVEFIGITFTITPSGASFSE